MLKKMLITLSLCLTLSFVIVTAQDTYKTRVDQDGGIIIVNGTGAANSYIMCTVLKPKGEGQTPYTLADFKIDNSIAVAFIQTTIGADGKFSLTLKLPSGYNPGLYQVKIGFAGNFTDENVRTSEVLITDQTIIENIVAIANNMSQGEIDAFIQNYNSALSLNTEYTEIYNDIKAQFITERSDMGDFQNINNITTCWNKALAMCLLRSRPTNEVLSVIQNYQTEFMITYDNIPSQVMTTLPKTIKANLHRLTGSAVLSTLISEFIAVSAVNASSRDDMTNIINTYANDLGITITNTYTSNAMLVNKSLANRDFTDKVSFKNAYDIALEEVMYPKTGNSSGNGSGSGGFVGTTTITPASLPNIVDAEVPFTDLGDYAWAQADIEELYKKGIVIGGAKNLFMPEAKTNREQFIKMLILALNKFDANAKCSFSDVSADEWYYPYVSSAFNYGITKGIDNDKFGIGQTITRLDMSVMIYRAISNLGITLTPKSDRAIAEFTDCDSIEVLALYRAGVINGMGDGIFMPQNNATRAETAKLINGLLLIVGGNKI